MNDLCALDPVALADCLLVGLHITCRRLDDRAVLRAAAAFAAARPWQARVSPMVAALDEETRA